MYYIRDFDELQQGILNINQTGLGITLYNNNISLMQINYTDIQNGYGDIEFYNPKLLKELKGVRDVYVLNKFFVLVDYDLEGAFKHFNFNYSDIKKDDLEAVQEYANSMAPIDPNDIAGLLQMDVYSLADMLEIQPDDIYNHNYTIIEMFVVINEPPIMEALTVIKKRCDGNNKKIVKLLVDKYKTKVEAIIEEEKNQEVKRDLRVVFGDLMDEFYKDVDGNHNLIKLISEVPVW